MNLSEINFFKTLDKERISFFEKTMKKKMYQKDEIVFYAGDEPKKLFILDGGEVVIYKNDENGNEVVMGIFDNIALLAEMPTITQTPYPASARATKESIVFEIDSSVIIEHISGHIGISKMVISSLLDKIQNLESIIRYFTISNSKLKVATYLYNNQDKISNITQREIAKYLMLTPEGLSRILREFKTNNVIKVVKKRLHIIDNEKLRKMIL